MTTFVEVPAEDIEKFLTDKGFTRTVAYREVVYQRKHEYNPDVWVKVYTSILVGGSTRKRGADSIKVCTVFDNGRKSFGLGKFPRVHRTGSTEQVLQRTYERMRSAYARGTEWIKENNHRNQIRQQERARGGYRIVENPEQFRCPLDKV